MAMRHSNMIDLECTAAASPFIMHNHRTICTNIRSNRHLLTRARTNLNLICVLCMMHMAMRHSNMIDLECTAAASPFIMHNHRTICTNIHSNRHLLTRARTHLNLFCRFPLLRTKMILTITTPTSSSSSWQVRLSGVTMSSFKSTTTAPPSSPNQ